MVITVAILFYAGKMCFIYQRNKVQHCIAMYYILKEYVWMWLTSTFWDQADSPRNNWDPPMSPDIPHDTGPMSPQYPPWHGVHVPPISPTFTAKRLFLQNELRSVFFRLLQFQCHLMEPDEPGFNIMQWWWLVSWYHHKGGLWWCWTWAWRSIIMIMILNYYDKQRYHH